ncbi:FtsK/SpoIIIE domain-containing protein [Pengzhenrongella frigida]|uniref:FHA domain-containing protein n=1 Tax=Pengzhenrongella frigida TaxID=1259133 RepID=A0A4Q5MXZ8_9MICO|nr:FtsK/SpoIIIE domain-containing protein [Cellulomonas sp. HLT2-17]RYV49833.1 FHA domain-containing protein [Cellulomonas sp. HLT2-17]
MRLTLAGAAGSPDVDLDVPDDARLGDLRPHLAAVTGRVELADDATVLTADGTVLEADQLTGQVPLLAGAVLRVGIGPADAARLALRANWHIAVVQGPDSGALWALDQPLVVGRAGELAIEDGGISRRHLELTVGRSGPRARDLGSSNGTVRLPARRRGTDRLRRRARRLPRSRHAAVRLRDGDRLTLGATVLEVRRRGSEPTAPPKHAPAPPARARAPGAGPRSSPVPAAAGRHPRSPAGLSPATWLGPAIGSLVLALSTGNRILLVLALLGPGVVAWPLLRERVAGGGDQPLRRRLSGRPREGRAFGGPVAPDVVPSPADLATWAVRLLTGTRPAGLPVGPGFSLRTLAPDGCLAVVGPRPLALAAARALLAAAVPLEAMPPEAASPEAAPLATAAFPGAGAVVVVRAPPGRGEDWDWCRWLASPDTTPLLVGDEPRGDVRVELARRWSGGHGSEVLVVESDRAGVPPWCRTVLTIRPGSGPAILELPDGSAKAVPLSGVSVAWAHAQARRVAALHHRGPAPSHDGPPAAVALAELPGVPAPRGSAVAASWSATRTGSGDGLAFCLGMGPRGSPVVLDLVRDGPHALVAGTTGAGKSELLQSMLLSLALTHSPADLAIALIDYKGGASFGVCADLPHVVGQVTDLDHALAARALIGLQAELRSRERILAAAGVSDLAALRARHRRTSGDPDTPVPPSRLLVVVDEFRALTEELPTFIPGLLRVAAQGRSLGIHLVLATQRPAGAVGADLRANLALRIALRVTDAADSLDVIDAPDAAGIPAALPGRAIVRRGAAPPESIQVAHADGVPGGLARAVRLAPPWRPAGPPEADPTAAGVAVAGPAAPARAFVDAACAAALDTAVPRPQPPWLPPLPDRVTATDLDRAGAVHLPASGSPVRPDGSPVPPTGFPLALGGFPLALADVPAEQRRSVVTWEPRAGHLLVVGAPGSGRSRTLHTVACAALERGWHVHAVGLPDLLVGGVADHPGWGTVVGPDDPRRLARLITLLAAPHLTPLGARLGARPHRDEHAPRGQDGVPGHLLMIDGLEATVAALAGIARGAGADRLIELLRGGRERGVAVVATATGSVPGPVAAHFTDRLVLAVGDRLAEDLAGIPPDLVGARRGPGRAVRLAPAGSGVAAGDPPAVLCQVALAEPPVAPPGSRVPVAWRLAALPSRVGRSDLPAAHPPAPTPGANPLGAPAGSVVIGLGGDDAGPVRLDSSPGALVVGPPGSGRSTVLAVIAAALHEGGRPVAVIARDGPLRTFGDTAAPDRTVGFGPVAVARLLDGLPARTAILIDDLETLEQQSPGTDERLATLVSAGAAGRGSHSTAAGVIDTTGVSVIASATTARAAIAYRGTLGALRGLRRGVVLTPGEPGSNEVLGVGLDWVVDPARPHAPGRGAVQHGRHLVAVQVLDPEIS